MKTYTHENLADKLLSDLLPRRRSILIRLLAILASFDGAAPTALLEVIDNVLFHGRRGDGELRRLEALLYQCDQLRSEQRLPDSTYEDRRHFDRNVVYLDDRKLRARAARTRTLCEIPPRIASHMVSN